MVFKKYPSFVLVSGSKHDARDAIRTLLVVNPKMIFHITGKYKGEYVSGYNLNGAILFPLSLMWMVKCLFYGYVN